jgi:hypothetical protein
VGGELSQRDSNQIASGVTGAVQAMIRRAFWFVLVVVIAVAGGNLLRAAWDNMRPHSQPHATAGKQDWSDFPEVKPSSPNDPWKGFPAVSGQK